MPEQIIEAQEKIVQEIAPKTTRDEEFEKLDEGKNLKKEQKTPQKTSQKTPLSSSLDFVVECLSRNERGDAELFLELNKDCHRYDVSEGSFYYWDGHVWKSDREKKRYQDIEIVSKHYEDASFALEKTDPSKKDQLKKLIGELKKRAFTLRSSKRCKSVFEFVQTSQKVIFSGEWDHCPGKLPCLNGVLDLRTGKTESHSKEDYIRSICPTAYDAASKRPLFDQFLEDITLGNVELKKFLGRVFGSALLGDSREEKIFILYGKDGRNGKGTLMQTLERVLGGLARTFPSEMLLRQRNPPSSSTPRPEKANLQGVRFAIFSEIGEHREIDASEVKNLSGRDTISCRRLFSNIDIQIKPSHTMFIQTNFKPKASSKDGALWKRTVLIPFNAEFVSDPKMPHQRKIDEGFKEKLMKESEGILAWLVEGCLEYQKIGLAIPEIVKQETENYRDENDGIERFLKEMCILEPVFSTPKGKMETAIREFCQENNCEMPTRNDISKQLKEKFEESRTNKVNLWMGVKIINNDEV